MICTRRRFGQLSSAMVAAVAVPALMPTLRAHALTVRGVELGLQAYTFHNVRNGDGDAAVDQQIATMKAIGIDLLELWSPQAEPFPLPAGYWARWAPGTKPDAPVQRATPAETKAQREALRAWREKDQSAYFARKKKRFNDAGIRIYSYNYSFEPTMTDAEIDAGFLQAKALGVDLITASSKLPAAERVVPFAVKHNMRVAFHGHSSKAPDEIASPESFAKVLAMSPMYRVNLDVAHFSAAGFDAVSYLKAHHDVITNIHVHDRKANDGASVPFGEGVAPTGEVLRLIRDNGWQIPVFYELEYVGGDGRDVIAETRRELDYEKRMLES